MPSKKSARPVVKATKSTSGSPAAHEAPASMEHIRQLMPDTDMKGGGSIGGDKNVSGLDLGSGRDGHFHTPGKGGGVGGGDKNVSGLDLGSGRGIVDLDLGGKGGDGKPKKSSSKLD